MMTVNDWTQVEIWGVHYSEISAIIQAAKNLGLKINQDFTVTVVPGWTNWELHARNEKSVIVAFQDPAWATWFNLKLPKSNVH